MALCGCASRDAARNLSFELKQVKIKDFTNTGFAATAYLQVDNANWFSIKMAELRYSVLVNDREVASGQIEKEVEIPGGGSVTAELPLTVGAPGSPGLEPLIKELLKGRLNYRIKGEVIFRTLLGRYTMQLDREKKPSGERR